MESSYFKEHLSLSQWVQAARVKNTRAMIREDATKRLRLALLGREIGLPHVRTYSFGYDEIVSESDEFHEFKKRAGRTLYAVRLLPRTSELPVLRNRKLPVQALVSWLLSLDVRRELYDC